MEHEYILSRNEFVSYHMMWTDIIIRKNIGFWKNINENDIIFLKNNYDSNILKVKIIKIMIYSDLYDIMNNINYLKIFPHAINKTNCYKYLKIKLNYFVSHPIKVMYFKIIK